MNTKNIPWRSKKYRDFVASHPCLICGSFSEVAPHHVNFPGDSGMGQKPSDLNCAPICFDHHVPLVHSSKFEGWDHYGIDIEKVIRRMINSFLCQNR